MDHQGRMEVDPWISAIYAMGMNASGHAWYATGYTALIVQTSLILITASVAAKGKGNNG
jgi:hypothetical protein